MECNSPPAPGLNQFWGSACPRIHTHTSMLLHFFCVQLYIPLLCLFCPKYRAIRYNIQIKKKKEERSTYLLSQFSGQKGKQTFYFLGLRRIGKHHPPQAPYCLFLKGSHLPDCQPVLFLTWKSFILILQQGPEKKFRGKRLMTSSLRRTFRNIPKQR